MTEKRKVTPDEARRVLKEEKQQNKKKAIEITDAIKKKFDGVVSCFFMANLEGGIQVGKWSVQDVGNSALEVENPKSAIKELADLIGGAIALREQLEETIMTILKSHVLTQVKAGVNPAKAIKSVQDIMPASVEAHVVDLSAALADMGRMGANPKKDAKA